MGNSFCPLPLKLQEPSTHQLLLWFWVRILGANDNFFSCHYFLLIWDSHWFIPYFFILSTKVKPAQDLHWQPHIISFLKVFWSLVAETSFYCIFCFCNCHLVNFKSWWISLWLDLAASSKYTVHSKIFYPEISITCNVLLWGPCDNIIR